ncbi:MAG: membrane associated rhomboid family serine protease [Sphingobacteriales bacterium]
MFTGRFPLAFILLIGLIELVKQSTGVALFRWGVFPMDIEGLPGILFSPLIHSGWEHWWNNSGPIFILGTTLFWFHKHRWLKIIGTIWLLEGLGVWLTGRPYFHIGASGLVYGLFAFVVCYGSMTKERSHLGAAFLAIFLYGSMVWGVFPIRPEHSWEGHLWGFVVGLVLGVYYSKQDLKAEYLRNLASYDYFSQADQPGVEWEYSYQVKEAPPKEEEAPSS